MTSNSNTKIDPGSIVLVPFPFSDLSVKKRRPCLILSRSEPKGLPNHLVLAMITSNLNGLEFPNDVKVKDLASAGLPKPSIIRLDKMVTLESSLVLKNLGVLEEKDKVVVKKRLKVIFNEFL